MKRLFAIICVVFFLSPVARAKDVAFVVGGGGDDRPDFVVSPANNWYYGLKNLGWEVEVYFGDAFGTLPNITQDQKPFETDRILTRLQSLRDSIQDGDNVFFILITHGNRCVRFNPVAMEDELQSEQVVASGDLKTPMQPLLKELSRIDEKNGPKGKVVFWNHSCFSGATLEDLESSGVCAITISGKNQVGYAGNFGDWISYPLAGEKKRYSKSFESAGLKEKTFDGWTLSSLLGNSLPLDMVTPAVFSNGFGLNSLNVESHAQFLANFKGLFPEKNVPEQTEKLLLTCAAENDLNEVVTDWTQDEKDMMIALNANRAFMGKLMQEVEDLEISYIRSRVANANISDAYLKERIRSNGEIMGKANRYYEIVEIMADWMGSGLGLSQWTKVELAEKISRRPIERSPYLEYQGYEFKDTVRKLYPLLADNDLKAIQTFYDKKPEVLEPNGRIKRLESGIQNENKQMIQARNELLGYAFSKNKTDCGTFNLKRK